MYLAEKMHYVCFCSFVQYVLVAELVDAKGKENNNYIGNSIGESCRNLLYNFEKYAIDFVCIIDV